METRERLFKFLATDGSPCHGGSDKWPLPTKSKPGKWRTVQGELIPCKNGLHLCRAQDLSQWPAPALFEAEYRGERIDQSDKIVVQEARLVRRVDAWNERVMRLWACDCAERVLHIYEKYHPADTRPREAITVARRFANGEATSDELAAARAAARAAAWVAAEAAARAAAGAAAWVAAEAAARAAAGVAARAAAEAAARAAAGVAGGDAAGDAAWVAGGDAAWVAAGDAARAAEHQWQTDRLMAYLDGTVAA